ncbi:hypothetical protein [Actinomadura napierensis]|uniref:hypothetical protein n=1 Tax=Actinomadura napierensis TaxID=267854 RepID=UPI0031D5F0AD
MGLPPSDRGGTGGADVPSDELLGQVASGHLQAPRLDEDEVAVWFLVDSAALSAAERDELRPVARGALAGPAAPAAGQDRPGGRAEGEQTARGRESGAAEAARYWLVPARPRTLRRALLARPPARVRPVEQAPPVFGGSVALHDGFVGAEAAPAVAGVLAVAVREIWGGFDQTATLVCRDGREVYAAAGEDGALLLEQHRAPAHSSLEEFGAAMWSLLADDTMPLAPFNQDLITAVLRRVLGRPGIVWGTPETEVSLLGQAAAVAWVARLRRHAARSGPLSDEDALSVQPPALRELTRSSAARPRPAASEIRCAPVWALLWQELQAGEELVPGMAAADAAWRDPGVLVMRTHMWAGDAARAFSELRGVEWFQHPRQASVVEQTLRALP